MKIPMIQLINNLFTKGVPASMSVCVDESFACFGYSLPSYCYQKKEVLEENDYCSWNDDDTEIHNIIASHNGLTLTEILNCFNKRKKKKISLQQLNTKMNKLFQQDYDLYIEDRKTKIKIKVKNITTGEVTIKEKYKSETYYFIDN